MAAGYCYRLRMPEGTGRQHLHAVEGAQLPAGQPSAVSPQPRIARRPGSRPTHTPCRLVSITSFHTGGLTSLAGCSLPRMPA